MAAAVGQSPFSHYRAAISAVIGTSAPAPADTFASAAQTARNALASGDAAAAWVVGETAEATPIAP
jgi:hypothetical protein